MWAETPSCDTVSEVAVFATSRSRYVVRVVTRTPFVTRLTADVPDGLLGPSFVVA